MRLTIFLDTGFYLGLIHKQDTNFDRARKWLSSIRSGQYGQTYTSNLVMAETATLVAARTNAHPLAIQKIRDLFTGPLQIAPILRIGEPEEMKAWEMFTKLADTGGLKTARGVISFVDCTSVITCQKHGIDYIATFDGHYKAWLSYPN